MRTPHSEEFQDFSDDAIDHNRRSDLEDERTILVSVEKEPSPEGNVEKQPRFSWVAFFVMIVALGAAWVVGLLFPGPVDDIIYQVVIASIYGFMQSHNMKPRK